MAADHPTQHLVHDVDGVTRFQANRIVRYLLDAGPFNLNGLADMPFDEGDWAQFYQLLGYSISGYAELAMVPEAQKRHAFMEATNA